MVSKLKKKKTKKVSVKLETPSMDIKDIIKYEKLKIQKPVLDVKKINFKKKQLEFKLTLEEKQKEETKKIQKKEKFIQEHENSLPQVPSFKLATHDSSPLIKNREEQQKEEKKEKQEKKQKEETKKLEDKEKTINEPGDSLPQVPSFELATHDSSPLIKERDKKQEEEKPVRNMENFLEQVPSKTKKENEVKDDKRYSIEKRYDQNQNIGYERRDERNDSQDFHEATARVDFFEDRNERPRARRVITDPGLERQEFKETGIAKYEIVSEHSSELDKYRRRRKT